MIDFNLMVAAGVPTLAAVIGYGKLQQQVKQHDREIEQRATISEVNGLRNTIEMTHELVQRLDDKLDRVIERGR